MSQPEIVQLELTKISAGNRNIQRTENQKYESDLKSLILATLESELEPESSSTAPIIENWGWSGESPIIKSLHYFLTKETFSMAVNIFRLGAFIKCVPFELESKNGENLRVRPFEKKWQWALWHIVSWIIFGTTVFEYISFYFLWQRTSFGTEMVFHIMYLGLISWIFLYSLTTYRKPMELIVTLNHHDEIMRHSTKLGLTQKHWASHPFVILPVYYLSWAFGLLIFVLTYFYLKHPERSQYIYSAFPSSWKQDDWILYVVCALFEFFWTSCGSTLLSLSLCYWCAHIYTFNDILNQQRKIQTVNEDVIESYLFLQLLSVSFNAVNSDFFDPGFCFVVVATPVLYIFLSLTTFHMLSIFIYLILPVFAVIVVALIILFLPQLSKVQIKSRDAIAKFTHLPIGARPQDQNYSSNLIKLSHLTEKERRGYLKRRGKAFRRLRIEISFFGAVCLDTSSVMMDQIINNVLVLLSL